ncbi:unnamed protein product [Effrenium voratum]|uniref:S-adenosylmethionine-dependent methyltransferase domain-containing protein n=1 Tax=Effrenium voratum TaxID=2562239 RepID=A0AA36NFK3_9DINO|nr:unnamed protein product [Effrenium voratum]
MRSHWALPACALAFLQPCFVPEKVWLTKDLRKSVKAKHPWLFDRALRGQRQIAAGSLVSVHWKQQLLAWGFYDPYSPLKVRLLWWPGDPETPDNGAWAVRLARAAAERRSGTELAGCSGLRLLHGEADGTPGLVLDAYDAFAVCGFDGRGAEAFWRPRLASIVEAFADAGYALQGVLRKNSGETLWGKAAPETVVFAEHGVRYEAKLRHGHKTGFFLDQRPNRKRLRELAEGKDVLDLFSYTGGFALAAAMQGAATWAVDQAPKAMEECRRNFALNGLDAKVCRSFDQASDAKHALFVEDCWDFLRRAADEKKLFDIAWPPACDGRRDSSAKFNGTKSLLGTYGDAQL